MLMPLPDLDPINKAVPSLGVNVGCLKKFISQLLTWKSRQAVVFQFRRDGWMREEVEDGDAV